MLIMLGLNIMLYAACVAPATAQQHAAHSSGMGCGMGPDLPGPTGCTIRPRYPLQCMPAGVHLSNHRECCILLSG